MFSKPCQHAIRGLTALWGCSQDFPGQVRAIGQHCGLPPAALAKVFQRLVRAGVLGSCPGRYGGYWLLKAPECVTLYDLKAALDGEPFTVCRWTEEACSPQNPCPYHRKWRPVEDHILNFLHRTTLDDMARALAEKDG